jgi:hypothetical protein
MLIRKTYSGDNQHRRAQHAENPEEIAEADDPGNDSVREGDMIGVDEVKAFLEPNQIGDKNGKQHVL